MPAQAAEVARVDLGTRLGQLLPAPAGGVWAKVDEGEVARIRPDGRITRTRMGAQLTTGAIGPDGQAWFGADGRLLRVDGEGAVSPVAELEVEKPLATAPDGRLIAALPALDRFALVGADGTVAYAASGRKACEGITPEPLYLTFASDGARWMVDGCGRLLRNGAALPKLPDVAYGLAPDATGGVWMLVPGDRSTRTVVHAHANGTVDYITARVRDIRDHAVAPDGSVWLALGTCTLARVTADGAMTTTPAPLPATQLVFDGTGELWLSNGQRVARGLGGACDDVAPQAELPKRLTLRALARGIPVTFREPVIVQVNSITNGTGEGNRERRLRNGGTLRYRLPKARLRELERAKRIRLTLHVHVRDREGNVETQEFRVSVRR